MAQARKSYKEGGIPIGAVLIENGVVIGEGHNERIQKLSATLHGEISALENAGRLKAEIYRNSTMVRPLD